MGAFFNILLVVAVQVSDAAPREADSLPEADFLEFLGSWRTEDGTWVDPFQQDEELPAFLMEDRPDTSREREFRDRRRKKRIEPGSPAGASTEPRLHGENNEP
ncbi:MAG: hypothetical protein AB1555_11840 [Nitrospirota bacterium]